MELEALETRVLLAAAIVTTGADIVDLMDMKVSMREAINEVNAGTKDGIEFDLGLGEQTVKVKTNPLPEITRRVTINGSTVPGQTITIRPDADNPTGPGANGIVINGANADFSHILGVTIRNFAGNGILLNNVADVRIGNATKTGGSVSVFLNGTDKQNFAGIQITGAASKRNVVVASNIGTDSSSTTLIGNRGPGVRIAGNATSNTIGGTAVAERNHIDGNVAGIDIESNQNTVIGNYIGVGRNGQGGASWGGMASA